MEDEDMSHDGAAALTEDFDPGEVEVVGSQGVLTPAPSDEAKGVFDPRRARASTGQRFRERSDSISQRMADANFFNRFDDDFDEDDMKLTPATQ